MQNEILLVDDDEKVLEILTESLVSRGYRVRSAVNGADALEAFEDSRPELIILDMMLPDISGIDLLEQLTGLSQHADVPVMFLSANADLDMRLRSLDGGAEDYLVKPVSLREFHARIETVLRRTGKARAMRERQHTLENQVSEGKEHYFKVTKSLKRQLFAMKTLFAVSQDLNRVLETDELVNVVGLTLLGELQVSSMALFALERENASEFSLLGVKGFDKRKFSNLRIGRDSQFTELLHRGQKPRKIARNPDRTWTRMLPDLRLAVFEYVTPILVKKDIKGFVFTGPKLTGEGYSGYDLDMMNFISNSVGIGMENARLIKQLQKTYVSTLKTLISIIEAKDTYTKGHTERVAAYSMAIANRMNLSAEDRRRIAFGALLHDIGKLGILEQVLHKEGKLDPDEWAQVRSHPVVGASVVENMEFITGAVGFVKHHHESWDGSGYPDGIEREEIPLGARIIAVADSFDAMTTDRSYRKALTSEQAIERLNAGAGVQFDPKIVRLFVGYVREKGYEMILADHKQTSE